MIAICINNSHTWRNSLTEQVKYDVLKSYFDPYAGYQMVQIKCDDEEVRTYRADRFILK